MLRAETDQGRTMLKAIGSPIDLMADLSILINAIYNAIRTQDAADAMRFKRVMLSGMNQPMSPVFAEGAFDPDSKIDVTLLPMIGGGKDE